MTGAFASYYRRIPVSHVEAGLRSGNVYAPWPEEVNRKVVGTIADQHFAPTERAAQALRQENVPAERIHITGNTVVDALLAAKTIVDLDPRLASRWDSIRTHHGNRRIILVTCHRRENFGTGILDIVEALLAIFQREDVAIVLPVHPNPNVQDVLAARLSSHPRVELIAPQEYTDFVSLLSLAYLVLTNSGVQERRRLSVSRSSSCERPRSVLKVLKLGQPFSLGRIPKIIDETFRLLDDDEHYLTMSRAITPLEMGEQASVL